VTGQLEALDALYIDTAPDQDEVWKSLTPYHVDGLHPEGSRRLLKSMNAVTASRGTNISVVRGERGTGKTHMVGWSREEIQARDGFFFYVKLVTEQDFWESATGSLVDGLYRPGTGGAVQLQRLIDQLALRAGLDDRTTAAVTGQRALVRADLDAFIGGIQGLDRQVGIEAADTARALVLVNSSGQTLDIGRSYLALNDDDSGQRANWGLPARARPAQLVLRDLTRLLALVGPVVLAFDQLDNLLAATQTSLGSPSSTDDKSTQRLSRDIALGLMDLREEARRSLIIVACQPETWTRISRSAVLSALDRVDVLPELGPIPDEKTAAAIVDHRFQPTYRSIGFIPPYPTWPISPAALTETVHRYSARRLLIRVNEHIAHCLRIGKAEELTLLASIVPTQDRPPDTLPSDQIDLLSELFDKLRAEADDVGPLNKDAEDRLMPALLGAGLRSLIVEFGGDRSRFVVETDFGPKTSLHARFRYVLDEARESEIHWAFRAIASDSPIAVQTRMRNAIQEAGLEAGVSRRQLALLRNMSYPTGTKTQEMEAGFVQRGGQKLIIGSADLRTLGALRVMLESRPPGLDVWLRTERPASGTDILAQVCSGLEKHLGLQPPGGAAEAKDTAGVVVTADPNRSTITLGATVRGQRPFSVPLGELCNHAVAIGASGSGKTVLVKRIIEQCALRGVSAVVLDPNGDLGRLGDPWPEAPDGWTEEQEVQARQYFSDVDVKVWTPGLKRGRPLSFDPVPDFGPVLQDEDDFSRLLTMTASALAPQAGIRGRSDRATRQLGVLQRALRWYVRDGGRRLDGLIEVLAEPPGDIVNSRTRRLAVDMADTLEAARETDPLLDESGESADPGMLLSPKPGRSARVSVISFIGLPGSAAARFVSLLQNEMFSWFQAHPTADRALGGLLVMDEAQNFVPSGESTPSTASTVGLMRQIRKFGLGVVLASQAPKGINHQALGNTANQFIGRLTAPAQINVAEEMARSRNTGLENLGGLPRGTFYGAAEGTSFSRIQVPICLSHHDVPLREEEVIERARRDH
jgi:uncharacterized protein DUF87